MINEYGEVKTPKQLAKDWILSALDGRMSELESDDEIEQRLKNITDIEKQQLKNHLRNYIDRMVKFIDKNKTK